MSLKKLGRYDLIRVLGKGAMGLVYEGRDPDLDRRVAIKTIAVDNLSQEAAAEYEVRFRTEARSAARLQHPNIVSVYDAGRDGDIAFIVMEFIQGDDLKNHLDKGKLYTLEQTLAIMSDLLAALDYAHRQNIVHRDIKPANLLMDAAGRVKLTDFGVARIQDSGEATRTQGTIVGTLKYMSPEQVQGWPVDARADLFAAGVVLFQLLTGKRPFGGATDFAIIQQIATHHPAAPTYFNPQLPPALDVVVALALAKSRDQRFASAQAFDAALQAACREAPDRTLTPTAGSPGPGRNATWTATLRPDEALVGVQSGTSAGVSTVTQELELVYWKDIKDSNDVEDLEVFLAKFPSGIYADLARRRLRKLGALTGDLSGGDSGTGTGSGSTTVIVPVTAAVAADIALEKTVFMTRTAASDSPTLPGAMPARHDNTVQVPASVPPLASAVPLAKAADAAPTSRRLAWALVGMVMLAGIGLGFKLLPGSRAPSVRPSALAAEASAAGRATAPEKLEKPLGASAPSAPAPVVPAPVAQADAAATSAPPAAAKASAALASAAARKLAKEQQAKLAQARLAAAAVGVDAAHSSAGPATERAAPAAAREKAANPRQACEGRALIGFQICMAEQCAKPAFAHRPVCVQRRAMEQQRRESEQLRR